MEKAKLVNIEITVTVTDNSGLHLGESSHETKAIARQFLPHLNPLTFAGHFGDVMKEAAAQVEL